MSERKRDKPKAYFDRLWQMSESAVDYETAPKTKAADWKDAEELIPLPTRSAKKTKRASTTSVGKQPSSKAQSQRRSRRSA
jgi:hypothetical protein